MRKFVTFCLILTVTACILTAGCVLASGTSTVPPAVTATAVPGLEPAPSAPAAVATATPREVVTIIRYVYPQKELKDSGLLFSLQVPAVWNVSTYRLTNADTSGHRTDLVAGDVFWIESFPITRSREQEVREGFREWSPAPAETTVTINGIKYDRFESNAGGNTTVAYLADANSANEHGYGSVLHYTARDSRPFEAEDFEQVVSSFRYFAADKAALQSGEEIPRYDLNGKTVQSKTGDVDPRVFDSSDWDSNENAGGSASNSGSTDPGSSSGGSSGGGCRR